MGIAPLNIYKEAESIVNILEELERSKVKASVSQKQNLQKRVNDYFSAIFSDNFVFPTKEQLSSTILLTSKFQSVFSKIREKRLLVGYWQTQRTDRALNKVLKLLSMLIKSLQRSSDSISAVGICHGKVCFPGCNYRTKSFTSS